VTQNEAKPAPTTTPQSPAAPPTPSGDPTPPPVTPPAAAAEPSPPAREPPSRPRPVQNPDAREQRDERREIDSLIGEGKFNLAKNRLRDRIAVEKSDAWAHLRLGDLYAEVFHYRHDAFREWDSALGLDSGLKSDAAFRKSVCETVDTTDRDRALKFLHEHFGPDEAPVLLLACIRAAVDPNRIENAAQLIESTSGPDRPELGMAAMRMLEVGKTCVQKKSAVETIRRLHYLRARSALVKLDRARLAQKGQLPPAMACFGTSIAEAIEQLK
jgi:hypothetical protein